MLLRNYCVVVVAVVVATFAVVHTLPMQIDDGSSTPSPMDIVQQVLREAPLVDGHNDLAYTLRYDIRNQLVQVNLSTDLTQVEPFQSDPSSETDIPRLRKGGYGGQFWSAYVSCDTQYKNAVSMTLEQIDVIHRFVDMYPSDFKFATTAADIIEAHAEGKIASLIGVEGGHSIDSSLAVLRQFYDLGVRYLTLTHTCNTPWADAANDPNGPDFSGITDFGKLVVKEMNRLGIFVDLAHVSADVMRDVLAVAEAPVIFSHSGAYSVCNIPRNVPDDVLQMVPANGGVVMIYFVGDYIKCVGEPVLADVADHIDYVKNFIGVDYVGIGSDFDGFQSIPAGLEDVSKVPDLLVELVNRGWTVDELKKLVGLNLIRALTQVEQVRDQMKADGVPPVEDWIPLSDLNGHLNCTYLDP